MMGQSGRRARQFVAIAGILLATQTQVAVGETTAQGNPYLELSPAFTVNVGVAGPQVSFAKVDVTLRLGDETGRDRLQHHQPVIRDILVTLLSNRPLENVETGEGREAIRAEALEKIQAFLQQEEGDGLVSDLLFTSFVVQR